MKLDISKCSDEEVEGMILDLQQTLAHRRQQAKRAFRKENPILGFSLRDEAAWKGFNVEASKLAEDEETLETIKDGWRAFPVRNPELKAALEEGDMVYFDPAKNTADGFKHKLAPFY